MLTTNFRFDKQSFLGKMKFGVSKILPNSLSKWLSPKVDVSSARRRRHEEMDSDDENANRNSSPLASVSDERYQTTPQLGAPPPNKKKKTFTVSIFESHLSRLKTKKITNYWLFEIYCN